MNLFQPPKRPMCIANLSGTGTAWARQRFFHGCLFLSGLSHYARISIVKRVRGWAKVHTESRDLIGKIFVSPKLCQCHSTWQCTMVVWGVWNKALFFKKKSKYTGTAWVRQRFFHGCLFLSGLSYYARISIVKRVKGWAKLHTYWESRLNWKNLCLNQAVPVPLKLVMHTGCISDEIKPYLKKNFWFISD